jgi:hypothetical protein
MKTQPEGPSAPESCSAQGSQSGTAGLERSSSSFRATVPAEELKQHIIKAISEARGRESIYLAALRPSKAAALYHRGYATALADLYDWVDTNLIKQALARNGPHEPAPEKTL